MSKFLIPTNVIPKTNLPENVLRSSWGVCVCGGGVCFHIPSYTRSSTSQKKGLASPIVNMAMVQYL